MNKVTLMGRLTRDPELRATPSGVQVTRFSLAVNRKFSKPGEDSQADFINIVTFNKTAEFCNTYFKKGQQVAICGRIQTSNYEKDGQKVYSTEVIADDVYFADTKKSDEASSKAAALGNSNGSDGFYPLNGGDDELPF